MKHARAVLLAGAFLFLPVADALPDQIKLTDGRVFEGKIVEETELEVKIQVLGGAAFTLLRKDIAGIELGKSPAEVMEERLEALRPEEPGHYEQVGLSCLEQKPLVEVGRRCMLAAAALLPARYADLQVRVGDSYTQARDRTFAFHYYARALLAQPGHAAALARIAAYSAEQRALAETEDPLQPPPKGAVDLTPSLRTQAERRLRRTGECLLDEDLMAGKLVYHKGAWMTAADKRQALGEAEPPPTPDWVDLLAHAAAGPASEPEWTSLVDAARAGTLDRATPRRTSFASAGSAVAGPVWASRAGRAGFRLTVAAGAGARAVLRAGAGDAFRIPPGLVFGDGAEITVVYRIVGAACRLERVKDREQAVFDLIIEPVGFELHDRPGGKTLAAWK